MYFLCHISKKISKKQKNLIWNGPPLSLIDNNLFPDLLNTLTKFHQNRSMVTRTRDFLILMYAVIEFEDEGISVVRSEWLKPRKWQSIGLTTKTLKI